MNFVESRLERGDGGLKVTFGSQTIDVHRDVLNVRPALERYVGREVIVGIRPQDFEDAAHSAEAPHKSRLEAKVDLVEALGTETLVHLEIDAPVVLTDDVRELAADIGGDQVERLEAQAQQGRNEFVAEVDAKSNATKNQAIELLVDTTQLHFFDRETSLGIYDE